MDYEKLRAVLPKTHTKWTSEDVAVWLQFIGLEALYPPFSKWRLTQNKRPSTAAACPR